jgi:hypothetical protein
MNIPVTPEISAISAMPAIPAVPAVPAIERVLVPIDFSETAAGAARYADALAQRVGARVTLLHVVPPLSFDYAMAEPPESRAQEMRQQRTGAAERALAAFPSPGERVLAREPASQPRNGAGAQRQRCPPVARPVRSRDDSR